MLSAALSIWLYLKNKKNKEVPIGVLYSLLVIRFLSVFTILMFLMNIFLKRSVNETENPLILVALDNSASMLAGPDSNLLKKDFQIQLKDFKKNIAEKYLVKSLLFGSKVESSDSLARFQEKETDLSELFRGIDNNYANQNIGALVLISDGIYNKGSNPIYNSEKMNFPMYCIATGDTSEFRDLAIQKVNHNQLSYSGNSFPVEVIMSAKKFSGESVKISLYEENQFITQQTVKINSNNFLSTLNFSISAGKPGLHRYQAKIDQLSEEKNKENNEQSFVIEIIDSKEKILLLANAPHPDISAIKEAITESSNYELEFCFSTELNKNLKAYNLVIIHGYNPTQIALINECKASLIPYWIINPATPESIRDIKISGSMNRFNDAEPYLVPSFGVFNLSSELKQSLTEFPAVKTFFGNYTIGNGVQSMICQRIGMVETENPLFFFSESDGLKTAVFMADGLWRWKLRDFSEHKNTICFNELITKSIQYLTVKADKSLFRVTTQKITDENKMIEFNAEVYNKSYEAITEPEINLSISDQEKKKFTYTFGKNEKSYRLNAGILPVGDYSYEARVKVNSETFIKQGSFIVKELMSEKLNTVANHQLLYQLSKRSKAQLFYTHQLKKLEEELLLNENIKAITYTKKSTTELIELSWIFWILLVLFGIEWFFRKRYLSI